MELDPRFKETIFMIEATSFEQQMLWCKFNDQQGYATPETKIKWKQDPHGMWYVIGHYNKQPVTVTFSWARLDGHLVSFYEATSEIVNHRQVRDFVDSFNTRHCDARNFHRCLFYIKELGGKRLF